MNNQNREKRGASAYVYLPRTVVIDSTNHTHGPSFDDCRGDNQEDQ